VAATPQTLNKCPPLTRYVTFQETRQLMRA
jgi:hypothetical protein